MNDTTVTITPSRVAGTARAPPSKSYTHRAILAAGYAEQTTVRDALWSADTQATARAVDLFGGNVERQDSTLEIEGFSGRPGVPADVIDCDNSGTTMRLVTAAAALADGTSVLTGDESLRSRPQGPLLEAVADLGGEALSTRGNGQAPLVVTGPLSGGTVSIPGDVSSQYITALLMAGAVTDEGLVIELETALKSAPYVDITLEVLEAFGVEARKTDTGFSVEGGQTYDPADGEYAVPGDFSSISYPLAAGAIAGDGGVRIEGAHPSAQGDTAIVDIVDRMGATVDWDRSGGTIDVQAKTLEGIEVSVEDTPDLLPTIATLGAVADGDTHITNAEHVRYKETDRVSAMAEELGKLGVETTEEQDSLTVHGDESVLEGATVEGRGDHRIIMALALAGLVAEGETTIRGAEHVDVSFPGFFEMLAELGVSVERDA
ncbi:3-phosphoshikimate 1-carboxyvinyltransferase [Natrialba magadii ATCC 43099]|uniref:3-phosphoshikimate 1-carboxyvinyltransferase n=1 Tax=Natrialba magadii (strain ATCC 43099 / DSM 3394 / CCM 3739 / CIP 104546 / IAM 13178 / JCM 8861 / NBRC 102185 / NCIMB 2190 / MS3) TaxID=547559 RepID=D3SXK1_NATMM|nr:3-phosphoshikimate 1-carboxyvinyltransferase [Natrialba magadii]ADD05950.1 3-phosphoshikimate 1-carboxyvinyltransferase [Natrialba magadii ATCC 43099]ELY30542.1 3-phosphoshikimate 1-carboxyvinyltransferase [Natrialba magadii ATCC 43099]